MRRVALVLFAMVIGRTLMAQSTDDILKMGQYNGAFATARSAAMAGAFGSLGADASSININPAGLGMYRSSEFSFTPMVQVTNSESTSTLGSETFMGESSATSFSVANASAVFNAYRNESGVGALKTLNLAVSYNRMNDFRAEQYSYSGYEDRSIGDMFAAQIYGIDPESIYSSGSNNDSYRNSDPYYWGAILAYNTGLLFDNTTSGGTPYYQLGYYDDEGNYVGSLAAGDLVSPALYTKTTGNISEYSFALGAELWSKLYVGMSFSFQDFTYEQYSCYSELASSQNVGDLAELQYRQNLRYTGNAFSFKFGATAELYAGWRVGAAVHTPSYYTVNSEYIASMQNIYLNDSSDYYQESLTYLQTMKVNTPTRFIASTSYVFGGRVILSADYERVWYSAMKVKEIDYTTGVAQEITSEIAATYKNTNNIRVGVEAMAYKGVSLRAGYGFYASPYQDEASVGEVQNITAGLGYRAAGFYVDFAYVNTQQSYPTSYYYSDPTIEGASSVSTIDMKSLKHNMLLTIGIRY